MKTFISFLLLSSLLVVGCEDFVEVDTPNSQLDSSAVFENATTANAAMADVYAQLRENGFPSGRIIGLSALMGAYSDELISYESGAYSTAGFYNNALLPSDDFVLILWNGSYNQIYACNAILEGVESSVTLPDEIRQQLEGEARFARSLVYLHLITTFGDVPWVTGTNFTVNKSLPRTSAIEIYQHIIDDLNLSISLLPSDYISADRTRPNAAVARALLARVYLYSGDNAAAADMASSVINDTATYLLDTDLEQSFLLDNAATIWQLASGGQGANTSEGSTFIFYSGPPYTVSLSDELVSSFEAGDLRKTAWIKEVSDGSMVWYHAYKYKQDNASSSPMEYSIQLRLAEQYLIRAEARARQGELSAAKDDLDIIRLRAGLSESTATTQDAILEAILRERRSELFTEQGHRFFDLKRFSKLNEVLGAKLGWNATDILWPLPQAELLANPNLQPQNTGY